MAPAMETGRGPDRATLKDVAALAGVHPGTASRAINAATRDLVNEETARRVLAAADELGYRPNPIARGLKTSRSYTVGVLIPDLTNPLFPRIVRGIQDKLEESGYIPLIANTDNDPARERADIEAMRARQVDGHYVTGGRVVRRALGLDGDNFVPGVNEALGIQESSHQFVIMPWRAHGHRHPHHLLPRPLESHF